MALQKLSLVCSFLTAVLLYAVVESRPQQNFGPIGPGGPIGGGTGDDAFAPPIYTYSYEAVDPESGNQYGHGEQRDGTVTQGEYRVLMPNGITKIVRYTVDGESGFQAEVTYE